MTGRQFLGDLLTVPGVLRELRRQGMTPQLAMVLDTQVQVASPGRASLARVREASEGTGDAHRLSPTDEALLALALEHEAILVTDDYSMQNVARTLGVPYEPVLAPGIRETWQWAYRCTGCARTWPEWHEECPVCGAPLKTSHARVTRGTRSGRGR